MARELGFDSGGDTAVPAASSRELAFDGQEAATEAVSGIAKYAGGKLSDLVKDLMGNLVTGIPEATYQLVGGKPGAAILTLGGSVAGPFARLTVDVAVDGTVAITSQTGKVLISGVTSEEAKEFASWLKDNGQELSGLAVAEVKERWESRKRTGIEFTTVTVGGKDYSVTHQFPPAVIDDGGNTLDPTKDKAKIRNIMLHVPFFKERDKTEFSDVFGFVPTTWDEGGAFLLGALNGMTFGAITALSDDASEYLDKYPQQAAAGEILSSIYGPGLAVKGVLWAVKAGRNKRVLNAIKKQLKDEGSLKTPAGLSKKLGERADEILNSSKKVSNFKQSTFHDIQDFRGQIKSALNEWKLFEAKAGVNRQRLSDGWERIFGGLNNRRPGGLEGGVKLENPFTAHKGPLGSAAAAGTKELPEVAGYWHTMLKPMMNQLRKNFNLAIFDTKYIITELVATTIIDFGQTFTDYKRQGLSAEDAAFQALLTIYVDVGENAASELFRLIFPGKWSWMGEAVAKTGSEMAGFGTGYTQEGLKRLSGDYYDEKATEADATEDVYYPNRGGLISKQLFRRPTTVVRNEEMPRMGAPGLVARRAFLGR